MCKLETEITIREAVEKLKRHINTPFVQLALARKTSPGKILNFLHFRCSEISKTDLILSFSVFLQNTRYKQLHLSQVLAVLS